VGPGERLLDDVLGRGLVAHHEQRQPYQPEVVFGEQPRDVDAVPGQRLPVGEQLYLGFRGRPRQ
jgi:hypothetical protein